MKIELAIKRLENLLERSRNDDGSYGIHDDPTLEALEMAIKALSNSENTNNWMPYPKTPPKKDGQYIVTYIKEDEVLVDKSYFDKHGFWIGNVVAWMPLPTPYKLKCCDTCRYSTNNSILPHNVCENHSRWEPKETKWEQKMMALTRD